MRFAIPQLKVFDRGQKNNTYGNPSKAVMSEDNKEEILDPDAPEGEVPDAANDAQKRKWVNYVQSQFKIFADSRYLLELDWALSLAFYESRQWLYKSSNGQFLRRLINEDEYTRYMTVNRMAGLIDKVESLATQTAPDVQFLPITDNEKDVKAAQTAEAIHQHYSALYDRSTQTKRRVSWALKSTTSFIHLYWDDKMDRRMPVMDDSQVVMGEDGMPQAVVQGSEVVEAGGVGEEILPGFSVYVPGIYKDWSEVDRAIVAQVKPLGYLLDRFGDKAKGIKPDAVMSAAGLAGYVDQYLDSSGGVGVGASPTRTYAAKVNKNAAVLYHYYELPNAKRPKGAYACVAGNTLLHLSDYPYDKKDSLPLVPLSWAHRSGTVYGMALAERLVEPQMVYNRVYSSILEQMENEVDYEVAPEGSNVGPEGMQRRKGTRTRVPISYNPAAGPAPQIVRAPGINPTRFTFLQRIEQDMRDIAGVHDVSEGVAPAGTPAQAVNMLQKADQTQHAHLRNEIERSAKEIAEWEVALEIQYAPSPFLLAFASQSDNQSSPTQPMGMPQTPPMPSPMPPQMPQGMPSPMGMDMTSPMGGQAPSMSDPSMGMPMPPMPGGMPGMPQGNPAGKSAALGLQSLEALRDGGAFHVRVVPGSAMNETPDDKFNKAMALNTAGALNPMNPGAIPFLRASGLANADQLIEYVKAATPPPPPPAPPPPPPAPPPAPTGPSMDEQMALAQHNAEINTQKNIATKQADVQMEMQRNEHQSALQIQQAEALKELDLRAEMAKRHYGITQSPQAPQKGAR